MFRTRKHYLLYVIVVFFITCPVEALTVIRYDDFNRGDALKDWKEKKYRGRVDYSIKFDEQGNGYVHSEGKRSATGRYAEVSFKADRYPVLRWRWRVNQFPDRKGKQAKNDDSDFGARIYVIFPSFIFINSHCLEYVFDEELPENTVLKSTLSKNVKLIVVRSGRKYAGKWVQEERNIYQDYLRLFGKPPKKVGAVAIMTDSDDTLSSSSVDYDDFFIGVRP